MTRAALWLVQVRNTGEPWRTVSRHLTRLEAEAIAKAEAGRRRPVTMSLEWGLTSIPQWMFVRLSYRGSQVPVRPVAASVAGDA